ncbi:hypothetical protein HaLaN_31320, partial [Haematococcus lacustris]
SGGEAWAVEVKPGAWAQSGPHAVQASLATSLFHQLHRSFAGIRLGYQDAFVQHSAHRRLTQNANPISAEAARASSAAVAPAISSVCGGGNVQAVANTAARASATATAAAVVKAGATTAGPSVSGSGSASASGNAIATATGSGGGSGTSCAAGSAAANAIGVGQASAISSTFTSAPNGCSQVRTPTHAQQPRVAA